MTINELQDFKLDDLYAHLALSDEEFDPGQRKKMDQMNETK